MKNKIYQLLAKWYAYRLPMNIYEANASRYQQNTRRNGRLGDASPSYLGGEDRKLYYYIVTCKTS